MTKSAVRAMDAVTAFMASPSGGHVAVSRLVVCGTSKRGWTTWTPAAVDTRVVAIAPAVIDLLNLEPSFVHHWRAYGAWSPAIQDYVDRGIMDRMGTPQFRAVLQIVEPFTCRGRVTMPRLLLNAAGDEFFLPDSSQFDNDGSVPLKLTTAVRVVPDTLPFPAPVSKRYVPITAPHSDPAPPRKEPA